MFLLSNFFRILRQDDAGNAINLDDIIGGLEDEDVVLATAEAEKPKEKLPPVNKSKGDSKTKKKVEKTRNEGMEKLNVHREAEAEKLPPAKKSKSDSKPKAPSIKSKGDSKTKKKVEKTRNEGMEKLNVHREAEAEKLPPAKKSKSDSKPKAPSIKSILKAKRASNGPTWKNNYSFRKPTTFKEKVTETKKKEEVYKYEKRDIFDDLSSSGSSIGSFKAFRAKKKFVKKNSLAGPSDMSLDGSNSSRKENIPPHDMPQTPIGDKVLNISETPKTRAQRTPLRSILAGPSDMSLDGSNSSRKENIPPHDMPQTPIGDKVLNISETPKTRAQRTPLRSIRKHTQKSPKINLPNELNLAEFIEALGLKVEDFRRLRKLFQALGETLLKIEQKLDA